MNGPFEAGEKILLVDQRDRRYLLTLQTGETWHSHGGGLPHDLLIGSPEGTLVHSATGMAFRAFRPRLADFVLKMPRGAQLVYPKDVGAILVGADVFPGARVLEAGTGSGSLTLALCRATGPEGRVVSYDLRREFQTGAARNIESFFGKARRRGERRDVRSRDPGPPGAVGDARAALDRPAPGRHLLRVPADDEPGATTRARIGAQRIRAPGDVRGAAPLVARDRSERASGSADGGAHRVHHAGPSRLKSAQVRRHTGRRPYA
jgi:tRNA (adenine57-N1/adenine58-N1)-methyltransferase